MTHQTLSAFGYPETELLATAHWSVLLRPKQVTLGSMVLVARDDVRSLGGLSVSAAQEFPLIVAAIEAALRESLGAVKFNYLCLMMVDPQVHFHVIPRYEVPAQLDGQSYPDAFWPKPPDVTSALTLDDAAMAALHAGLRLVLQAKFAAHTRGA